MKPTMEPQSQDTQKSTEQQSPEEKQLTLEELASITGGRVPITTTAIKMEDRHGNKGEVF
jgi:bacteriocin-like protein